MKARTFIITTGAILALTASAAQANLDRMLPAKHSLAMQHKVVAHKKVMAHKVTKQVSTSPRYIHFPGPAGPTSVYADDCLTSGNNCTDQQLCDIWSMNCDLVTSTPPSVATLSEAAPDAISKNTAPSTQVPPADTSTVDNTAASDMNSVICPSGGLWDEDHQYCV